MNMRQEITKTTLKSLNNKKLSISFQINKTLIFKYYFILIEVMN